MSDKELYDGSLDVKSPEPYPDIGTDRVPDSELKAQDYNLKISRFMEKNFPKVEGEHRFISTAWTIDHVGGELMADVRWCYDCGTDDERAGSVCRAFNNPAATEYPNFVNWKNKSGFWSAFSRRKRS